MLSPRFSLLVLWLLAAYYLLNLVRYSLLATHGQLLPLSSLMSSADRCTSSRIDHPCSRFVILLFAPQHVNVLLTDVLRSLESAYYSYHSTLIASYTLFLVARIFLFEICCFMLADRCALLSSCFSLLFASHSVLLTRILLLADCCFMFLISLILIKYPKLVTFINLNMTRSFRSNGVVLNLWEHNFGQILKK